MTVKLQIFLILVKSARGQLEGQPNTFCLDSKMNVYYDIELYDKEEMNRVKLGISTIQKQWQQRKKNFCHLNAMSHELGTQKRFFVK